MDVSGRLSPEGCGSISPNPQASDFLDPACPLSSSHRNPNCLLDPLAGDLIRMQSSDIPMCRPGNILPWGAQKEHLPHPYAANIDLELKPGEFVMRTLFAEFTLQAERKIEAVMGSPQERPLSKELQVGEDATFDQLLSALGQVAEHCLPSLLRALFAWYERQMDSGGVTGRAKPDSKGKSSEVNEKHEADIANERRDLAVEFIFCLVLIQVLRQLPFHPGHEDLVGNIENLAFKHFKYREGIQNSPNAANIHIVADLYAEVIGVLAQSRFQSVRKRFMSELKELRTREPSPHSAQSIIALLMGMKFFRVKMVPIEEFEASFQFMHECAQYFLEVKDKDIKHALAGLFVEILVPVAAAVKNEVNVPCLKNFVELLYSQTLDLCMKNKHRLALFPLVTCLLCVSQKGFFLQYWHCFLALCLQHLKNRDPKMCRVALESLYRLLWVYMIRIKCESNTATHSRLQSIVNSLFPKGSKGVVPRDTPLNIFVKIIQFIAQERLDFAMREIVFDLLSVGRPIKIILTPERMSIGLRAFLVVADSLQQKEGEPPMPRSVGVLPSGNTLRVKKTYLNKMLTEDTARSIGMSAYFPHVRLVFVHILRALDTQYGRPLMMTNTQNVNKEPDEMITGERKPRIDLFRTCVAAVPRLVPDGMTGAELVDLLSRLTVHMDEELRGLAYQSLQTLVLDFPAWRHDVLSGFVHFLSRDVQDTFPQLLDNGLRMLLQLLSSWRHAGGGAGTVITTTAASTLSQIGKPPSTISSQQRRADGTASVSSATNSLASSGSGPTSTVQTFTAPDTVWGVLHQVEGFALVMLCHCRPCPRRLAVHILKEVKHLLKTLPIIEPDEPVLDVIDQCCPEVIEKCMPLLPLSEKAAVLATPLIDLQWITERNCSVWTLGWVEESNNKASTGVTSQGSSTIASNSLNTSQQSDPWGLCLVEFMQRSRLLTRSPQAVSLSWPFAYVRVHSLFAVVDPTPVSDNRASLLRGSGNVRNKPASERDMHLCTWRNYAIFAYRVLPPIPSSFVRCASPDLSLREELIMFSSSLTSTFSSSMSPESVANEKLEGPPSSAAFYKLTVPLLRCEVQDLRDAAVQALGHCNPDALKDLMDELLVYIREAVDRKQENMRRRKRRDGLRLHLARVFDIIAEQGTFGISSSVFDREAQSLHTSLTELIEGTRLFLESDKDIQSVQEIKLNFCNFIRKMIKSFPLETCKTLIKRDLRSNLFTLFSSWTGRYNASDVLTSQTGSHQQQQIDESANAGLLLAALQAMSAVLCCGPAFNPSALAEDGALYPWLDLLLAAKEEKIHELGCQTVILLLENNLDIGPLLDWVVDRCFTAEPNIADGCFLALATVFSIREYPCDHYTAIINVTLLNTGCPRTHVHETALQLLQSLDKRFFGPVVPLTSENDSGGETLDLLLSASYCRSQMYLSKQLAELHPELTMPMFSEITHRLQSARASVRQLLLQYLLPWLHNMELVDPNVPPGNPLSYYQYCGVGRREGWGSAEATEMVLNNLFYITTKFSDEHPKAIEDCWSTLCSCWPNNLKVIIRYLIIISGMAPHELLPYTKRVVVYLARARPDRLLDEMMSELQTVETLNCVIERTETPPFYRLTSIRKILSHSDPTQGQPEPSRAELTVEKGTIHTKRHSGEDPGKAVRMDSAPNSQRGRGGSGPSRLDFEIGTNSAPTSAYGPSSVTLGETSGEGSTRQPHPLPMPEYGGFFAPLTEYLPDSSQPVSGFHRCNVAVMLLTDVVVDGIDGGELDWTVHVPLMLHILLLGMDHSRQLVHEHCKTLLLNMLLVLADHSDHLAVAQILLASRARQLGLGLHIPDQPVIKHNFTEPDAVFDSYLVAHPPEILEEIPSGQSSLSSNSNEMSSSTASTSSTLFCSTEANVESSASSNTIIVNMPRPGPNLPMPHVVRALISFLASRASQCLWAYEDITAKVWSVRSAEQLEIFLQHLIRIFRTCSPGLEERWSQTALQLGLSSSSRHLAGRSLQIFRALRVPITSRMLSDILSRLVETVSEQGEDMQGYVTELLLTLEAAVDSLESDFRPLDFMKEIFKSTPNLNNKSVEGKRSPGGCGAPLTPKLGREGHARSTSYSVSYCLRRHNANVMNESHKEGIRHRAATEVDHSNHRVGRYTSNLARSRSAQSLKLLGDATSQDDKMTILAQLFWVAVSLLESDYEHEFLLALRLLSRVLHRMPLDRPDARDKVEKLQQQLRWTNFPGVHALLLKGCTSPSTYEAVVPLLSQFTLLLDLSVIDPTQSLAFPMNVIALLPYLLVNFEDANELCVRSAENIAQASADRGKKLGNLGTVMTLYSRRNFSKESFQWTKCVVKYLYDTYAHLSISILSFLVEVLEKGPGSLQPAVLSIIHCLMHYMELSPGLNSELLRVISKHMGGAHWREALKIVKLVVTRSSSLVAPSQNWSTMEPSLNISSSAIHPSFTDNEMFTKKELPGRTMEFTFDVSQTPVIGRKFGQSQGGHHEASPRRSASLSPADAGQLAGWKRPWSCQGRVRECLVAVLTTCGQRVGLPKSPSVIFSQSSDLMERQSSMASSTEEVSAGGADISGGGNSATHDQFGVFKDFDFLEYESESVDGDVADNFNWGVRRRPLLDGDGVDAAEAPFEESVSEATPIRFGLAVPPDAATCVTLRTLEHESSDEEAGSGSPMDEIPPSGGPPGSLRLLTRRSSSPARSDTSGSSGGDLGDVTPCNASPNLSGLMNFRPILRDDSEETWRKQMILLLNVSSSASSLELFQVLCRVLSNVSSKCVSLTREACTALPPGEISEKLLAICNLYSGAAAPYVWYHVDCGHEGRLRTAARFVLLDVQEHLETFFDRKDHVLERINAIRPSVKLHLLPEEEPDELINDLTRSIYKMQFQWKLLIEAEQKMLSVLSSHAKETSLMNLSTEVASARQEVLRAIESSRLDAESPSASPGPILTADLGELVKAGDWSGALQHVKRNREWTSETVVAEEDDVAVLNAFCRLLTKDLPSGVIAVIPSQSEIGQFSVQLRESLYLVLNCLNQIELQVHRGKTDC